MLKMTQIARWIKSRVDDWLFGTPIWTLDYRTAIVVEYTDKQMGRAYLP